MLQYLVRAKRSYPAENSYRNNETCAEVDLPALMDHTGEQFVLYLSDKLLVPNKTPSKNFRISVIMTEIFFSVV